MGGGRPHLMDLADANTGLSTDNLMQTPAPAPVKAIMPQQDFSVKAAVNKAKTGVQNAKAEPVKKSLEQANKVGGGGGKTLDELIKEYGMEAEADMVNTGDWAQPYGNFFATQYDGVVEALPG